MCKITTRKTKAASIERRITIGEPVNGIAAANVVEITNGKKIDVDYYFLRRQASAFGVAFKVEKVLEGLTNEAEYDVCLSVPGHGHTCDCKWGCYGGHKKPCRHIELALQAIGERKL